MTRDLRSDASTTSPTVRPTRRLRLRTPSAPLPRREAFDVVAHFAAHKHVRSEKDRFSIEAMARNNVLATVRLLDLLAEAPPERFFCVSTDKAANPANVMGATKKLMEDAVLAYAGSGAVRATTARFANVAFSNGSLPAGFLERLAKRQPLSAPSDVRRYFVSPEESGQLPAACVLGEPGDILFPRLARARDAHLLRDRRRAPGRARAAGRALRDRGRGAGRGRAMAPGDRTWPVHYFASDTSGEKPTEEFHTADEEPTSTGSPRSASRGRTALSVDDIRATCADLAALFERRDLDKAEIVAALARRAHLRPRRDRARPRPEDVTARVGRAYPRVKRVLDVIGAGGMLLVLSALLGPVAVVLGLTAEGEVFYKQTRVGRGGREFGIWKFATMLKDSPNMGTGSLTVTGDPRVTRVGRVLRATKVNELPQLINVLTGDMSFVGPRPQVRGDFEAYSPEVREAIGAVTPGITGIGSTAFRDEQSLLSRPGVDPRAFYEGSIAPYKGALEAWYLGRRSLWTDARIIAVTAWAVLSPGSTLVYRVFPDLPPRPEWLQDL